MRRVVRRRAFDFSMQWSQEVSFICGVNPRSYEYGKSPHTSVFDCSARSLTVLHFKPPIAAVFIHPSSFHILEEKQY